MQHARRPLSPTDPDPSDPSQPTDRLTPHGAVSEDELQVAVPASRSKSSNISAEFLLQFMTVVVVAVVVVMVVVVVVVWWCVCCRQVSEQEWM